MKPFVEAGCTYDAEVSEQTGEWFIRDPWGNLFNVYPVAKQ